MDGIYTTIVLSFTDWITSDTESIFTDTAEISVPKNFPVMVSLSPVVGLEGLYEVMTGFPGVFTGSVSFFEQENSITIISRQPKNAFIGR